MDEIQMMRDLFDRNEARAKPVFDAARVFIDSASGLRKHSSTCLVCRVQEPTIFTCSLGHAIRITTNTYLTILETEIRNYDNGTQPNSKSKTNGPTTSNDKPGDAGETRA